MAYEQKRWDMARFMGDYVKSIDNINNAVTRERGKFLPGLLSNLAFIFTDIGFIDKAKYYYQEKLSLDRDSASYFSGLSWIEFCLENFEEALKLEKKAGKFNSAYAIPLEYYYCLPSTYNQEAYLNATKWIEYYKKTGGLPLLYSYRIAMAFLGVGKQKEANSYLEQQIKYDQESIKLGRDIVGWYAAYYDLAATYSFLGDQVKAYKYLDELDKKNFYFLWWISLAKHDPLFASIHKEERFQKILQNMEAKYQAENERVRKWLEEQGML